MKTGRRAGKMLMTMLMAAVIFSVGQTGLCVNAQTEDGAMETQENDQMEEVTTDAEVISESKPMEDSSVEKEGTEQNISGREKLMDDPEFMETKSEKKRTDRKIQCSGGIR